MKRLALIVALVFVGCGNQPQPEDKAKSAVKTAVETAKKVIDPCERDKMACLAKCKLDYPTEDDNLKLKACVAKCYTIYGGCKTAEAAKKGYKKTKEFIDEKINN